MLKIFTQKEKIIIDALSKGKLNKEISADVGIALNTVKKHVTSIYKKIGARNRCEAIIWYLNVKK